LGRVLIRGFFRVFFRGFIHVFICGFLRWSNMFLKFFKRKEKKMELQLFRDNPKKKYQQGDVIIRLVDVDTGGFDVVEGDVIVQSPNPHTISGDFVLKRHKGALFVEIKTKATFCHREHRPIALGKGTYFTEQKVEIDFLSDMVRPVQD